ncbi:MAG: MFS transporter, partial [Cyanobacteria bacterium J06639_1]
IFGPALGGVLAAIALKLPAFVAGGIALGNTLLGYFTLPESLKTRRAEPIRASDLNPIEQLGSLFAKPQLRFLLIGYFIFFLSFTGFTNNFSVYVRDRFAWGPPNIAGILLVVGIVSSIVQGGLIRKLVPRFGETRLAIAGLSTVAIALTLVALSPVGWYLYGIQSLFALGVGMASPSLRGAIANAVSDTEQGAASGGSQSLGSLTQILGPFFAGLLYDNLGATVPIWMGAGLTVVAIAAIAQNATKSRTASPI